MKLTIKIKHGTTETTVGTLPADVICWERMTKQKISQLSGDNIGVEDLAIMAWSAAKRSKANIEPFEIWIDELQELEVVDDEQPNPTQAEA